MTAVTAATPSGLGAHRRKGAQRDVNWRLAIGLAILVALAPLPLGSNRPIFWSISTLVLAMMGMVYGLALWRRQQSLRLPLARIRWIGAAFLLLCLFLLFQALPVSRLLGLGGFITFD